MKSLEIVNEHIEGMERQLALMEEDRKNGVEWYNLDPLSREIECMYIIKADLEVLGIIKNNFKYWVDLTSGTPYLEGHCEVEKEDREKLKQWLEENKDEKESV